MAGDSGFESRLLRDGDEQTGPSTLSDDKLEILQRGLAKRGSLQIWFDPAMPWLSPPTGRRGRQIIFSDTAIQTCLTLKALFKLPLRQTTGMVASLMEMAGLDWPVPVSAR